MAVVSAAFHIHILSYFSFYIRPNSFILQFHYSDMKNEAQQSPLKSLFAGAASASLARFTIAPIERVNIIYQISSSNTKNSISDITRRILQCEGVFAFWKGTKMALIRIAPYMGVKFMLVEQYARALESLQIESNKHFFSGSAAGVSATLITYPMDMARARMSASTDKKKYTEIFQHIYSEKGVKGMYRGMSITLRAIALHDGMKFGLYDLSKVFYSKKLGITDIDEMSSSSRLFCGFCAGAVAQTICYPADVLRRRMQTSSMNTCAPYQGFMDGLVKIFKYEGVVYGLYKGWGLSFLKACPNIAIYMTTYDLLKKYV